MAPTDVPGAGEAEWLREYGAWALLVVCFGVIVFLFRAYTKARDDHEVALTAHTEAIKLLTAEHKKEMGEIVDRLIETSTTQVREYHMLAEKITSVMESLSKRLESKGVR